MRAMFAGRRTEARTRDAAERGCAVSLIHAQAWAAKRGPELRKRFGLIADPFRPEGKHGPGEVIVEVWNNVKVQTLRYDLRERFLEFLERVTEVGHERGFRPLLWDAARTLERQVELYARGRVPGHGKRKVTWTIASNHLFGGAIDVAADRDFGTETGEIAFKLPRWWRRDGLPLAKECGLRSLYLATGKDPPHIEVRPADRPPELRSLLAKLRREFRREWRRP